MAEEIDSELEPMKEYLTRTGKFLAKDIEDVAKNLRTLGKTAADMEKVVYSELKSREKLREEAKKEINNTRSHLQNTIRMQKEGLLTSESLSNDLERLRREIGEMSEGTSKSRRLLEKSYLEEINARNEASQQVKNAMGSMAGALAKSAGSAIKESISKAFSGDAMGMAETFMKGMVDMGNAAAHVGTNALSDFGKATAGAGGRVGALGVGASLLGSALGGASDALAGLAKEGVGFMFTQTSKLITEFQTMSNAGAIYAGGMIEMTQTALNGGMTLEQFSKAVSTNKDILSKTGLGVGIASKRMAESMAAGGEKARNSMFALGMSMDEQADATAQTMALMAGPAGKLKSDTTAVTISNATQDYAKNLKLISDLTGQDAKARLEKVRQENDTLAFNSVLNGMSEVERLKTVSAMAAMSEVDQRAFREKKIYGNVISSDIAASRALSSALAQSQDDQFKASEAHTLDVQTVTDGYQKYGPQMLKDANELGTTLGKARSGPGVEIAKAINDTAQYTQKFANASLTAAQIAELANKNKKDTKDLKTPEVQLMALQQTFAKDMQNIALSNLGTFATSVRDTIVTIQDSVKAISDLAAKAGSMPAWAAPLAGIGTAVLAIAPLALSLLGMFKMPSLPDLFSGGGDKGSKSKERGGRKGGSSKVMDGLGKGLSGIGKGIGSIGAGAGNAIGGVLRGLANGLTALGSTKVLMGVGALIGIGGAVFVLGKALKIFAEVDWESIGKATVAVGAFAIMAGIMGAGPVMVAVGIGIGLMAAMAGSIWLLAEAFKSAIPAMEPIGKLIKVIFGGIADILSVAGPIITSILSNIGGIITSVSNGIVEVLKVAGPVITSIFSGIKDVFSSVGDNIVKVFKGITSSIIDLSNGASGANLVQIGKGLFAIGGGLATMIPGLLALAAGGASGFKSLTTDLLSLSNLDPVKLDQVAISMKKLSSSLPSALQIGALGLAGGVNKLLGSNTPNAATVLTPPSAEQNGASAGANIYKPSDKSKPAEEKSTTEKSHTKNMVDGINSLIDKFSSQEDILKSLLTATNESNSYLRKIHTNTN
jgi:hypothetical protein